MKLLFNRLRFLDTKKIKYVAVGLWNTIAGCLIFSSAYWMFGEIFHYLFIALCSHLLAVLQGWLMYRHFVFKSSASWLPEYIRFNISSLIVLAIQLCGLWILVDRCAINPLLAQPLTVVFTVVFGYMIHSSFSFRDRDE